MALWLHGDSYRQWSATVMLWESSWGELPPVTKRKILLSQWEWFKFETRFDYLQRDLMMKNIISSKLNRRTVLLGVCRTNEGHNCFAPLWSVYCAWWSLRPKEDKPAFPLFWLVLNSDQQQLELHIAQPEKENRHLASRRSYLTI